MPYDRIVQLPDSVRNHLPTEAQQIYKEAFNHAWEEYAEREDREATAHKVAWAAVKKKYRKIGEKWVEK
ncbi:ChaB family protein [Thiohalophilus sp.]|uniref:ChaB family protein n=1 Tax=Thiohalophilus sp. TaxID=3028392 RepID=UPI002ACE87FB|nr:ChaB family protein [Thiohalophilus sp.]MDZ7663033.1 ChaB family protein [Thiohalophilus sp.]